MKTTTTDLLTEAGERLSGTPWQVYPRPQMVRDSYLNLNGRWDFAVGDTETPPKTYSDTILVPFPPQSRLSGIGGNKTGEPTLFYRRVFSLPEDFRAGRVLLHFGAVDQTVAVYLNGVRVGAHAGGYLPFSLDVTDQIRRVGNNTLTLTVRDTLSDGILPWGKQKHKRGGMWYTPVSGIWQTVWAECVPQTYIRRLVITADTTGVTVCAEGVQDGTATIETPEGAVVLPLTSGKFRFDAALPRLWSPDDPYLYRFTIRAGEDTVSSYFALRTVTTGTVGGIPRLLLNGKPFFFHGVLDQGYFSDGIYLPAAPEEYERDITRMRALGFNTIRKHIKVEPEVFYAACDRLGMLVFQDMVNNGRYSFFHDTVLPTLGIRRKDDSRWHRDPRGRRAFLDAMEETVARLANHPCICYWTIFNEGWGQFDGNSAYRLLKQQDPTRPVDTASGWFRVEGSDVESLHVYFRPVRLPKRWDKPLILSEFGGYSYATRDHVFHPGKSFGYRFFREREAFVRTLRRLYEEEILPAIPAGLCGAILTQLSDVEDETNGLVTYDRRVEKVTPDEFSDISDRIRDLTRSLS